MTILLLLIGVSAAIAAVGGYVAWRDRRSRGSFVDPAVSRDALALANWRSVQGRKLENLPLSLPVPFNVGS